MAKYMLIIAVGLLGVLCGYLLLGGGYIDAQIYITKEWGGGFKTSQVVAERETNNFGIMIIGFDFLDKRDQVGRTELNDFMKSYGGSIVRGGGWRGPMVHVKFHGVCDRESADKKIKEMLPKLSRLVKDLGDGNVFVVEKNTDLSKFTVPSPSLSTCEEPPQSRSE